MCDILFYKLNQFPQQDWTTECLADPSSGAADEFGWRKRIERDETKSNGVGVV
jgi:hypothetical protein